MKTLDLLIFGLYMAIVLGIGLVFFRRNQTLDDYYVGGRRIGAGHVGLSVVATDVGGGFSIGLGGVGYTMGLSGSWLLFTGLVGAWVTAVLVIPRIKAVDARERMLTFPDFLRWRYDGRVAMLAAVISGIGYMGFTGGQILAGAKLASATILTRGAAGLTALQLSIAIIAFITIVYTVLGGLKAAVYTDTVQWVILLVGLMITVPVALWGHVGGPANLWRALPPEYFSLTNLSVATFVNWMVTIIPIWFVAMTLYQRIYACRNTKEARKAWYIAGILEYPVIAFLGVFLGMCSRVVFPEVESEMGLPMLIGQSLPVVVTGLIIAAYFSAIMSTADSCLMASSGNIVSDVLRRLWPRALSCRDELRLAQVVTLVIGVAAVVIAWQFERVLEAIMFAYAFLVSGLFVPTLGALLWRRGSSRGAFYSMLSGGLLTLILTIGLPGNLDSIGLDPICYGLVFSAVVYVTVSLMLPDGARSREEEKIND